MPSSFAQALADGDLAALRSFPKSDVHVHSTKGCRRSWLEEQLRLRFPPPPERFDGLEGMQAWFTAAIKPHCAGPAGLVLRWEGAFAEAARSGVTRLSMSFGAPEIELVGGMEPFCDLIGGFHRRHCPRTAFEPELTHVSTADARAAADALDRYAGAGFFRAIDVCGIEGAQPVSAWIPLYRKAERYGLCRRMHVGECGTAQLDAVRRLGLEPLRAENTRKVHFTPPFPPRIPAGGG